RLCGRVRRLRGYLRGLCEVGRGLATGTTSGAEAVSRGSGDDTGDDDAVVALASHGLQCGGVETGLGAQEFDGLPRPADRWVVVAGVDHRTAADDVVHHDHTARPAELQRPADVVRVVDLVRVDERQVERSFVPQCGEDVQCSADTDVHPVGQAGPLDVAL